MTIRIGRGATERIAEARRGFALQVLQASDVGGATKALKLARVDLLGLAERRSEAAAVAGTRPASTTTVSPVVVAPAGPMVLVELLEADAAALASAPQVVADRLERAGLASAVVDVVVPGGRLDALDNTSHAVVLRLFPTDRGPNALLPPDWLDIAGEWVTGDLADDEPVRMRILGVEADVPAAEVAGVLHEAAIARGWSDAVNGVLADKVRTASLTFGRLPHLALAAGGPNVDSPGLLARYALLADVARELAADVAYACIDFEPAFDGLALGLDPEGWELEGGAPPNVVARDLLDDRVPDAYPYQVLGPGHVARLEATGAAAALPIEPLGEGRVELIVDDPRTWLTSSPDRPDARAHGWELLRPLLVEAGELDAVLAGTLATTDHAPATPSAAAAPPPPAGTPAGHDDDPLAGAENPELDAVVLEPSPHGRRGSRLTLLELAAWLGHEAHSDSPAGVAPVLATYARWLAAGLDHDDRQALKHLAPRLVGTNDSDPAADRARSWAAVECLVRVHAPAWLRAAGLPEAGERLQALGPLTNEVELVRAVELLGTSIAIASRRVDVALSVADGASLLGGPDEQAVWEIWEEVGESTGWVAASEAATHGAPPELTYATDLRVIECSRDPKVRADLETLRQTIADAAWAAALHAMADEAWERGWRAADTAARELSGFTIRIEMGRVAKAVLPRGPGGEAPEELPEAALEVAEKAARDHLTRSALRGGLPEQRADGTLGDHPWDAARQAAEASEGGDQWTVVLSEARKAVGEDGWAQGMADAREVVGALLSTAPDTVARVVVAAVAREASSAAARGLALRVMAAAKAEGATQAEAAATARTALEQVGATLRPQAVALLETLAKP